MKQFFKNKQLDWVFENSKDIKPIFFPTKKEEMQRQEHEDS